MTIVARSMNIFVGRLIRIWLSITSFVKIFEPFLLSSLLSILFRFRHFAHFLFVISICICIIVIAFITDLL